MTIGSPRAFFSVSRGSVIGRRDASSGMFMLLGSVDMEAPYASNVATWASVAMIRFSASTWTTRGS